LASFCIWFDLETLFVILGTVAAFNTADFETIRVLYIGLTATKTCHVFSAIIRDIKLVFAALSTRNVVSMRAFSWML